MEVYVYTEKKEVWLMENNTFEYKKLVISKAFTTKPKKPISTVLKRCVDFIYERVLEGYREEIPGKVFDLRFREEIGYDRFTLKKYFGNNKRTFLIDGSGKKRAFRGEHEPGAFEKFGLVERIPFNKYSDITLLWKITPYFWIKLKEVYPQRKIAEFMFQQQYEGLDVLEKQDISLILQGKECEKTVLEVVSPTTKTNNNNNNSERDIFFGKPENITGLSLEEQAILDAKPLDSEPDRSKPIRRVSSD